LLYLLQNPKELRDNFSSEFDTEKLIPYFCHGCRSLCQLGTPLFQTNDLAAAQRRSSTPQLNAA
jgi:hypothetical protein